MKCKKFYLNIRKNFFYCVDDQALAQVAQRGCAVSILGDSQSLAGNGHEQPLAEPALSKGSWTRQSPEVPSHLNSSVSLLLSSLVTSLSLVYSGLCSKDCVCIYVS